MGKLSVLGAQRIKALEGMLDEKLAEELTKIDERLSKVDASEEARKATGIDEDYNKAMKHIEEANELFKRVSTVTGDNYQATRTFSSNYRMRTEYKDVRDELANKCNGKQEKEQLKREYNKKKQMLWLCETLEEAKEIVGIE